MSAQTDDSKVRHLSSVAELIELEEALVSRKTSFGRNWSFRGQPRDYGTLTPSFQRQFVKNFFGAAEVIEKQLIAAFREHYEKLRDRSPEMPMPDRIGAGFDLRCLSVMQHYEIPTRLLDWTSSFWTAIYFACASDPGSAAELWFYDRSLFDKQRTDDYELASLVGRSPNPPPEPPILSRRDLTLIELDPHLTPRMDEQMAHHTVACRIFSDHAPVLASLAGEFTSEDPEPSVQRVIIDASCKVGALQFLAEHRQITAGTIFPDVVGLSRFLRWQFESLRSMMM